MFIRSFLESKPSTKKEEKTEEVKEEAMDVSVSQSQKDVRDIYILKLMFMRPAI